MILQDVLQQEQLKIKEFSIMAILQTAESQFLMKMGNQSSKQKMKAPINMKQPANTAKK